MPTGWRIVKTARASTAFDGEGARLYGGRWNSRGVPMVYTAQSASLAAMELLVHLQSSQLLMSYCFVPAVFADSLVEALAAADLPPDWAGFPAPGSLQQIGDAWAVERSSAVLQVPSAVVPGESNYLLNPVHADFGKLEIGEPVLFEFDSRLR